MNILFKPAAAAGLAVALAACTTASQPSLQARLSEQIAVISTVDQQLLTTQDVQTRHALARRKQEAVRASAGLLTHAQAERLGREQACMERERHLPSDAQTCFGESPEDTEARLLRLLVQSLAESAATR